MTIVERSGPLTSSQESRWFISTQAPVFCYSVPLETPPLLTEGQVKADISTILGRHEALRTRFTTDRLGNPIQEVLALSSIDPFVVVAAASDPLDMLPKITEILSKTATAAYIRLKDGFVERAVLHVHKAAIDGIALELVKNELAESFSARSGGRDVVLPEAEWHPIDEALRERTERSLLAEQRTTSYWERRVLSELGTTVPFNEDPGGIETDIIATVMCDSIMMEQCDTVAKRIGISHQTVFMTALLISTVSWSESEAAVINSAFSRRISRKVARSVGHYSTDVDIHLRFDAASTFELLSKEVGKATLNAYAKSGISALKIMEMRSVNSARRGRNIASSIHFNYRAYLTNTGAAQVRKDREFRQTTRRGRCMCPYIDIEPVRETCAVSLRVPENLMSQSAAIAFLEHFAEIIESAAESTEKPVHALVGKMRAHSPWVTEHWKRYRGAWTNLERLRCILEEHNSIYTARVFIADDEVVACVATDAPPEMRHEILGYIRVQATWDYGIAVPDRTIFRKRVPALPENLSSWAEGQLATESVPELGPDPVDEREELVAQAFLRFHPKARLNMGATYAELHGNFLRIPAMIRYLTYHGHTPLDWRELAGIATLRDLARK